MTSLCIDCGLCCDGTMYATVGIVEADGPRALEAQGFKILVRGERQLFEQACVAFRGGCCAVYETRPGRCRRYRCALLRRHEAGDISTEAARALIAETIAARDRVRPKLLQLAPAASPQPTATLIKLLDSLTGPMSPAERRAYGELLLDVGTLRMLLLDHFEPRQDQVEQASPTMDDRSAT